MADRTRVAGILAEWRDLLDDGCAPDPEELIRRHPEHADALREHFDALGLVELAFVDEMPTPRPLPERLGDYRILERLGEGGMGVVYLAEAEAASTGVAVGSRVAIKVLHNHLLSRRGYFKRFLREADIGRRVRHENVVRTIDVDATRDDSETAHFLVMEYVEGRTLRELLADLGTVPEALVREIAAQVAAGLTAIHDAGIVHRDLKPENVLITPDHRIRIMDLGVARMSGDELTLTEEGQFVGSLAYAAPEQFGDASTGPAADLYALGVLLYELATGTNPFHRDSMSEVMAAHLNETPRRADDVCEDLSPFLVELIMTLLAKDAGARLASAAELGDVLDRAESGSWWREHEAAARDAQGRLPRVAVQRQTKLHGREDDLERLRAAWESARSGSGRTILVEGEAGIGKTRLVDEFLRGVVASDVFVLYGSYPPTGGMGGLSDALLEHFGRAGLADALTPYLSETPTLVPAFAALLGQDRAPDDAAQLQGDAVHAVFVNLLRALSEERPLIWVVDDLHFASSDSRRIVLSLARAISGTHALLVVTTRPEIPEQELTHFSRLESFSRMRLARLGARDVVELLQEAFGSVGLAEKLGGKIALRSDGVPFFVFEMIRGLKEGQFITQLPDGSWVETRVIDRIEVPAAVRDLIEARLRGLSDERRALLDVAAVNGYEFDPDLVARVLERRRVAVLQDLAAIERRWGVIRAAGRNYRFDHHQIQEMLYEGLHEALRTEYHALFATTLEERSGAAVGEPGSLDATLCVQLCEHALKGEDHTRASRYLEPAIGELRGAGAFSNAVRLMELALASPGMLEGDERARMLTFHAELLGLLGRRPEAREVIDEARELAREAQNDALEIKADLAAGWQMTLVARYEDAEALLARSMERAHELGLTEVESQAAGDLGSTLHLLGRHDESRRLQSRRLELSRASGDRRSAAVAVANVAITYMAQDQYDEARRYLEEAIHEARAVGQLTIQNNAMGNLASVHRAQGRMGESLALRERVLTTARSMGYRDGIAVALVNLGTLLTWLGDLVTSVDRFEQCRTVCREIDAARVEGYAIQGLAVVADWSGDAASAEALYREALTLRRELEYVSGIASSLLTLGTFLLRSSRLDEALPLLSEAEALSESIGDPGTRLLSRCYLDSIAGDGMDRSLELLAEHDAQFDREDLTELRLVLWKATLDPVHLNAAHDLLSAARENAPERYRQKMVENVPLYREIADAWAEHGARTEVQ